MKKIFTTAAAIVALSATTAHAADDWDNTTYGVEMISGPLDFSIDVDNDGLTDVEVGYTALEYNIGENVESNVRFALSTGIREEDDVAVIGQYNISMMATPSLLIYGTAEVAYATDSGFSDGDWLVEPSAGAAYSITDTVAVYGEVGYTWDMSNDFDQLGGYVEVGLPVAVTDAIVVTPSVSQSFGTDNDVANFRLEATFMF
jgi:hypothetical protein